MFDRHRHQLALRAIAGSTDAAIRKAGGAHQIARIRGRADDLLTNLEAAVMRDGGDDALIAKIERTRRRLGGASRRASQNARGTGRAAAGRRAAKRASSRDSGPTAEARGTRQQPRASNSR